MYIARFCIKTNKQTNKQTNKNKSGKVAHTCNPSYSRQRSVRSWFKASPGKRFKRPLIYTNKKLGVVVHTCHSSYLGSIHEEEQKYKSGRLVPKALEEFIMYNDKHYAH
jgi:hypothetical protein